MGGIYILARAWIVGALTAVVSAVSTLLMPLVEADLVPDVFIRLGIRSLLWGLSSGQAAGTHEQHVRAKMAYVKDLKQRDVVATHTAEANEQHYEVPSAFYDLCLGPLKKYSSGLWASPSTTLQESEEAALQLVCQRADITNRSLKVLDMGCGWGSATLYIASTFPAVQVTAVSNSRSQKAYIDEQARRRCLKNVTVITCDINTFEAPIISGQFDRVVTIEMLEHVKNYERVFARASTWLKPGGKMFVHIFAHREFPFHYVDGWMAKNFFTGGQMPSDDLLLHFQRDLTMTEHWIVPGTHYARTCEAWLQRLDTNRAAALAVTAQVYGERQRLKWLVNWRLFFLACAELFAYGGGNEWAVSHYLFVNSNERAVSQ